MARPANGWTGTVAAAHRTGRPLALMFDYDGTLTPIVRHPSLARLLPEDRERLARLGALPRIHLAFVSGRALEDLRSLVALESAWYAGSGGAEIQFDGERRADPLGDGFGHVLDLLHEPLVPILARYPGAWIERKPVGMSLHYRALPPLMAISFRREIAELLADWPKVRHREVSQAIELSPAGGWDKGTAVDMILARLDPAIYPVFIGDAVNDAEAMQVTNRHGGLSVGIGEDAPTEASVRVHGPAELAADLEKLIADLGGHPRPEAVRVGLGEPTSVTNRMTLPPG